MLVRKFVWVVYYFDMNRVVNLAFKPSYLFSTVVKKKQMELTLRTPYRNAPLT